MDDNPQIIHAENIKQKTQKFIALFKTLPTINKISLILIILTFISAPVTAYTVVHSKLLLMSRAYNPITPPTPPNPTITPKPPTPTPGHPGLVNLNSASDKSCSDICTKYQGYICSSVGTDGSNSLYSLKRGQTCTTSKANCNTVMKSVPDTGRVTMCDGHLPQWTKCNCTWSELTPTPPKNKK